MLIPYLLASFLNANVRVFETRVLRQSTGLEEEEGTRDWTKLHSKELHDLYGSPNIIRVIRSRTARWVTEIVRMGRREMHRVLVRKTDGNSPLERPRRSWDDIKFDLKETGMLGLNACGGLQQTR